MRRAGVVFYLLRGEPIRSEKHSPDAERLTKRVGLGRRYQPRAVCVGLTGLAAVAPMSGASLARHATIGRVQCRVPGGRRQGLFAV